MATAIAKQSKDAEQSTPTDKFYSRPHEPQQLPLSDLLIRVDAPESCRELAAEIESHNGAVAELTERHTRSQQRKNHNILDVSADVLAKEAIRVRNDKLLFLQDAFALAVAADSLLTQLASSWRDVSQRMGNQEEGIVAKAIVGVRAAGLSHLDPRVLRGKANEVDSVRSHRLEREACREAVRRTRDARDPLVRAAQALHEHLLDEIDAARGI